MPNTAASHLVVSPYSERVVIDAAKEALNRVGGRASCAFVFCSPDYQPHLADFFELIQLHGHAPLVAGCSASGLIGTGNEAERASGFSLLLLNLPNTRLHPLTFPGDSREHDADEQSAATNGLRREDVDAWIVLANPFTLEIDGWLKRWNTAFPGVVSIGGLASGGQRGDDIFLWRDRALVEGGVAIGLQGGVRVHTLVSQGCRPVGQPLTITGAEHNFVISLGSRPAYEVLEETYKTLPESDKALARGNLFVGLAMSEYKDEFKTGDFLVRNLIGADPQQGVIAIGAHPRVGQTLQFQIRDRASAHAELSHLASAAAAAGARPFASLLFACNGRGRHLFGEAHHDARLLSQTFGEIPTAGFFCNGEIGPVAGRNFVHGYTASTALFTDQ